jgi:hypothetical protein
MMRFSVLIGAVLTLGACGGTPTKKVVTTLVCKNDDTRCGGKTALEVCTNGAWAPKAVCTGTCTTTSGNSAICDTSSTTATTNACTKAGSFSCEGSTLYTCTNSVWTSNATCANGCLDSGSGNAACDAPCTNDQQRCNNTAVEVCKNKAWAKLEDCGAMTCVMSNGVTATCDLCHGLTADKEFCVGATAVYCEKQANGSFVPQTVDCAAASVGGSCYDYGKDSQNNVLGVDCLIGAGKECGFAPASGSGVEVLACDKGGKPDPGQACSIIDADPAKDTCVPFATATTKCAVATASDGSTTFCDSANKLVYACVEEGTALVALIVDDCSLATTKAAAASKRVCRDTAAGGGLAACTNTCTVGTDNPECSTDANGTAIVLTCTAGAGAAPAAWVATSTCSSVCIKDPANGGAAVCAEKVAAIKTACQAATTNQVCYSTYPMAITCNPDGSVAGAVDCTTIDPLAVCGNYGAPVGSDCIAPAFEADGTTPGTCSPASLDSLWGCGTSGGGVLTVSSSLACNITTQEDGSAVGTCVQLAQACSATATVPYCDGDYLVSSCAKEGTAYIPISTSCADNFVKGHCTNNKCVAPEGGYCELDDTSTTPPTPSIYVCAAGLKCVVNTGASGGANICQKSS